MTFAALLDRTVTIVPRLIDTGVDDHGDEVIVDGTPIENVRAGRDLEVASENDVDRDAQTERFVYFLPPGTVISGFDEIIDGDDRFRVVGEPEVIVRRRGRRQSVHHIEAVAEQIS